MKSIKLCSLCLILSFIVNGNALAYRDGQRDGQRGGDRHGYQDNRRHSYQDGRRHSYQDNRRHSRVSVWLSPSFGVWGAPRPYYAPTYAPYSVPVYMQPPIIIERAEPPVYIEQAVPQAAAAAENTEHYWYYCADVQTYYPYVKDCPGGWQRVAPQPQDPR